MKHLKSKFLVSVLFFVSIIFLTCTKENQDDGTGSDYEFAFEINASNIKNDVFLKSAMAATLSDVKKIILTIQNMHGSSTQYTAAKVNILRMNGSFYSEKLVLKKGSYKLTEFDLIDSTGNTIYAAPLAGSQEAQNVNNPLPITFQVTKNLVTPINVEVIGTAGHTPEDFGFTSFPITEVKTFGFRIGVMEAGSDIILSAKLTVSNGSYAYIQNLDSILNNVVTVKEGLGNYTLKIQKIGYGDYSYAFTEDSLKMYRDTTGNLPLLIDLEKLTVTDYDGNVYKAVQIGSQIWMAENLKTTHYTDGQNASSFIYDDNPTNIDIYGRLYERNVVMRGNVGSANNPSGIQGVCPSDWHVPSADEWMVLIDYLGGSNVAGGKLKESGTLHWQSPNMGATDEYGFSALPGGLNLNPSYRGQGTYCSFWSSTYWPGYYPDGWVYAIYYDNINIGAALNPGFFGLSVRCVKD